MEDNITVYRDDILMEKYIERMMDGFDMDTVIMLAHERLRDVYEQYTYEQMLEEIREMYPDLLEE